MYVFFRPVLEILSQEYNKRLEFLLASQDQPRAFCCALGISPGHFVVSRAFGSVSGMLLYSCGQPQTLSSTSLISPVPFEVRYFWNKLRVFLQSWDQSRELCCALGISPIKDQPGVFLLQLDVLQSYFQKSSLIVGSKSLCLQK